MFFSQDLAAYAPLDLRSCVSHQYEAVVGHVLQERSDAGSDAGESIVLVVKLVNVWPLHEDIVNEDVESGDEELRQHELELQVLVAVHGAILEQILCDYEREWYAVEVPNQNHDPNWPEDLSNKLVHLLVPFLAQILLS